MRKQGSPKGDTTVGVAVSASSKLPTDPPADLPPYAADMHRGIQQAHGIADPGGLLLLETAARAYVLMEVARGLVEKDGAVVYDRWGQPKPHPAVVIARDARSGMLAALKALHLDVEPVMVRR